MKRTTLRAITSRLHLCRRGTDLLLMMTLGSGTALISHHGLRVSGINVLCGVRLLTTPYALKEAGWLDLPTVWLRDLSLLAYLSAGGVIATIVVVICLLWVGVVDGAGFHRRGTTLDLVNLPVVLGLYGYCYSGHSVFPNIASLSIVTIVYAGVTTSGFLMFGEPIKSQFTLNMSSQFLSSKVSIWTTVVNPLSKYALTMTPVALSIEELLPSDEQSHTTLVLIRTMLVFSTLFVALAVPFFGLVMALLGSVFAMLVASYFILRQNTA